MQSVHCGLNREWIHGCTHVACLTNTSPQRGTTVPQARSGTNEWKWIHFLLYLTIKTILQPLLHNAACFSRPGWAQWLIAVTAWWFESLWDGRCCLRQICSLTSACKTSAVNVQSVLIIKLNFMVSDRNIILPLLHHKDVWCVAVPHPLHQLMPNTMSGTYKLSQSFKTNLHFVTVNSFG